MRKLGNYFGIIVTILIIALIVSLRFYKLGEIPQGLNIDEASYGYDAYSLFKTGKDQWGYSWPTVFTSFGDYKPPGLTYLIYLLLHFLPLSTFVVRLPSALAGLGILYFAWKTSNLLFPRQRHYNLWMTAILATSPWLFGISRLFFEVNVGLFFISWQLYLIIKLITAKHNISQFTLIGIGLLAAIAGYLQSSLRYIALGNIIIFGILMYFSKNNLKQKIQFTILIPVITALFIQLPLASQWIGRAGLIRLQQEDSKRLEEISLEVDHNRNACWLTSNHNQTVTSLCYYLWNKPVNRIEGILKTGIDTISPTQIFLNNFDHYIIPPEYGAYSWTLVLLVIPGIYYLFSKLSKQNILLLFLIIESIAITSSVGLPSVHRNVFTYYLIFLLFISGIHQLSKAKPLLKLSHYIIYTVLLATSILNFRYLVNYFYIAQSSQFTEAYNAGNINSYLQNIQHEYTDVFDDYYFVGPLLHAFYTNYDPLIYQQSTVWSDPNQFGNTFPVKVGNYQTRTLDLQEIACSENHGLWITKTKDSLLLDDALINFSDRLGKLDVSIYDLSYLSSKLECQE